VLDTYRSVETPEGVELGLRVAGPPVRLLAWGIDVALRVGGYAVLAPVLALAGETGLGVFLVVLFLGEWFYPVYFEVLRGGATPGKRRLGLLVLHDDGTPVGWTASVVRNLVRFADFLPVAFGLGLLTMLVSRDFKRLGDLAAGTLVVHRSPETSGPGGLPGRRAEPPPVPLLAEEQRAVAEFARRLSTWTAERAEELAELALPLTRERGGPGVERLVAISNWLVGRR
jgi:uncharacterized RDD family membrane protein YckC